MSKPTVSIQGYPGSFHDIARQEYFNNHHNLLCRNTFKEVFADVKNRHANFGMVAIENSLYGSINEVYDLLLAQKLWITGEIYMRIHHCLIGLPGTKLKQIKEVHSQLPALGQCEDYLDKKLPGAERIEQHDTAASVAAVAKWQDPSKVAIGSFRAAKLHNLKVLAEDIETHKQNYTRFVVLQHQHQSNKTANKTSSVLTTLRDKKPGALHRALGVFATDSINLSMLQSRPLISKAWHYMFYIDFEAGLHEARTKKALKQLQRNKCNVTVLGSYQQGKVIP